MTREWSFGKFTLTLRFMPWRPAFWQGLEIVLRANCDGVTLDARAFYITLVSVVLDTGPGYALTQAGWFEITILNASVGIRWFSATEEAV